MWGSIKQRLIIIDKSKMVESKMAAWRLRLLYLSYYPTWEGGGLSFRPQKIHQTSVINYRRLITIGTSTMAGWPLKCSISQLLLNPER